MKIAAPLTKNILLPFELSEEHQQQKQKTTKKYME